MRTYNVILYRHEVYRMEVKVEASSKKSAENKASRMLDNGEVDIHSQGELIHGEEGVQCAATID